MLDWITQLIRENDVHRFYASPVWRKKQAQILRENHYDCERCKRKGLVVRARTVHHKKYLREHPELALEDENLEPICERCHYEEHHKKRRFINEEHGRKSGGRASPPAEKMKKLWGTGDRGGGSYPEKF